MSIESRHSDIEQLNPGDKAVRGLKEIFGDNIAFHYTYALPYGAGAYAALYSTEDEAKRVVQQIVESKLPGSTERSVWESVPIKYIPEGAHYYLSNPNIKGYVTGFDVKIHGINDGTHGS